jgi:hypothetical protein
VFGDYINQTDKNMQLILCYQNENYSTQYILELEVKIMYNEIMTMSGVSSITESIILIILLFAINILLKYKIKSIILDVLLSAFQIIAIGMSLSIATLPIETIFLIGIMGAIVFVNFYDINTRRKAK